jgi:hypothetical protein
MADVRGVADLLVAFGRELEADGAAQVGGSFTGRPEADAFLREDPNAFLIGVLFTQGIPAERAWSGPWELRARLGFWDMDRLAREPAAVRDAFHQPPMLHRFKNTVPIWVSRAAARLIDEWGGRIRHPRASRVPAIGVGRPGHSRCHGCRGSCRVSALPGNTRSACLADRPTVVSAHCAPVRGMSPQRRLRTPIGFQPGWSTRRRASIGRPIRRETLIRA